MPSARDTRIHYLTVAYLAGEMNMTQEQIAKRMNLSQSAVSRLFTKAKTYLVEQPPYRFRKDMVDDSTMNTILQNTAVRRLGPLLDKFAADCRQPRGPVVRVVQVRESGTSDLKRRFTA